MCNHAAAVWRPSGPSVKAQLDLCDNHGGVSANPYQCREDQVFTHQKYQLDIGTRSSSLFPPFAKDKANPANVLHGRARLLLGREQDNPSPSASLTSCSPGYASRSVGRNGEAGREQICSAKLRLVHALCDEEAVSSYAWAFKSSLISRPHAISNDEKKPHLESGPAFRDGSSSEHRLAIMRRNLHQSCASESYVASNGTV